MSKARDIADLDFNSPDIDGGNIDGAVIGGTTAAAGSFTTVSTTSDITVAAGAKLQYNSDRFMTPENNVDGAEISANGIFKVKTGSTPVERFYINTHGNVGFGVTPETNISSTWQHIQFGGTGALIARHADNGTDAMLASNYYVNGSNVDTYLVDGTAARIFLDGSAILIQHAGSGTADSAITWATPLSINTSGDATFTGDVALNNGSPELYFGTTGNHFNWRLAAQEAVDAAFEISVGSQDTNYGDDTYTPLVIVKNTGSFEIGYGGAPRQQADSQALTITTPASGGGQGIALKRLDSNNDQTLGEISWSNNTQDGLSTISSKTSGAVNSTDMHFKVNNAGSEITAITIDGSASGKTIFGGNIEVETGGYPLIKLQTSSSNYFEFLFDNPNDRLRIGKNGASHLLVNSSGVIKTGNTEFLGFEDAINILNHDPVDGGTDFDQTPTNNSDGGQTLWQMAGDGNAIDFYSTSGGHSGTWMKVYCDAGLWAIKGSVRLTNTDGAVHGGTSPDNYKFTHSFLFAVSGGPSTGNVKFDADAAASNTGTDFTRIAFSSAPVSMTAGYKTITYSTNGYEGVQRIYITDLQLVRVG